MRAQPREANGHVDLEIFVVRLFLWLAYAAWGLAAPVFPRAEGSMPVVPLVVLAGAAGLFLFRDRRSIDLLLLNSAIGLAIVPPLFALNVYRGVSGALPAAWADGPWYAGAATFLGLQAAAVALTAWYARQTARAWRGEPAESRRRLRNRFLLLLGLLLALAAVALSFVAQRWAR